MMMKRVVKMMAVAGMMLMLIRRTSTTITAVAKLNDDAVGG